MTNPLTAAARAYRNHIWDICCVFAILAPLAALIRSLWPFLAASQWDEIQAYLGSGLQSLSTVILDAQWSPLYMLWYHLLFTVFHYDSAHTLLLNEYLLPSLLLIFWFILLRQLGWPRLAAVITVLALSAQPLIWTTDIKIHIFSLLVCTVSASIILLFRGWHHRLCALAALLFPLSLTRPEVLSLYPACFFLYFACYFTSRTKKPDQLRPFLAIFILSVMGLAAVGMFSGKKSGETYLKKQWERFQAMGDARFSDEIEFQKALFPHSNGFFSAVAENPKEVVRHSLFHVSYLGEILLNFMRQALNVSPLLVLFLIFFCALLVARSFLLFRHGNRVQIPAIPLLAMTLIGFPQIALTLTYGTLERYNVSLLFVLGTLTLSPLVLANKRLLLLAYCFCASALVVNSTTWAQRTVASYPDGFWMHYISFSRQFKALVPDPSTVILTNCGAIWPLVTSDNQKSQNTQFMAFNNPFDQKWTTRKVLKQFDVLVFCPIDQNENDPLEKVVIFEKEARAMKAHFTGVHLSPMDANMYVSNRFVLPNPMPDGTRLLDK